MISPGFAPGLIRPPPTVSQSFKYPRPRNNSVVGSQGLMVPSQMRRSCSVTNLPQLKISEAPGKTIQIPTTSYDPYDNRRSSSECSSIILEVDTEL